MNVGGDKGFTFRGGGGEWGADSNGDGGFTFSKEAAVRGWAGLSSRVNI